MEKYKLLKIVQSYHMIEGLYFIQNMFIIYNIQKTVQSPTPALNFMSDYNVHTTPGYRYFIF